MTNAHLKAAALAVLDQGIGLLKGISPDNYARSLPQAFNASIGGHYRHCLDHFECLQVESGAAIDYDARRRDERIERDVEYAAVRTHTLAEFLGALPTDRLDEVVKVRCKVAYTGADSPTVTSTLAREIMYSVIHAVHHYALIGVMCRILEVPLAPGFGVAPSTVQHHARLNHAGAR